MSLLIGIIFGSIIAAILPNPLIWLDEKWQDMKRKKRHFESEVYFICDDHCFWGYSDCPHCKKNEEGLK